MNSKDSTKFATVMKVLAVNAGVELTKDMLRVYFEALKAFSIEQIQEGTKAVLLEWRYARMPPLAVIIDHITGRGAKIEDRALVLANEIIAHLRIWGATRYPDLSHDSLAAYLMLRRWPYKAWASQVIESELHWWAKEFCEAYRTYSETDLPLEIEGPEELKQLATSIGNVDKETDIVPRYRAEPDGGRLNE